MTRVSPVRRIAGAEARAAVRIEEKGLDADGDQGGLGRGRLDDEGLLGVTVRADEEVARNHDETLCENRAGRGEQKENREGRCSRGRAHQKDQTS